MQKRLASLDNVLAALGLTTADTAKATRLADAASRVVSGVIQRPYLFRHSYRDVYDGAGRDRQMLRNWPVLSVDSLNVGQLAIPAAAAYGQAGYRLEPWDGFPPGGPQSLTLNGYSFSRGSGNVAVAYAAGYAVLAEPHTVPSADDHSVTADEPLGTWAVDDGVAYANGEPLAKVTNGPAQGQYAVTNGKYTFNAADASQAVLISYSFIPADIEQAVIAVAAAMIESDLNGNIKSLKAGDATIERFSASAVSQDVLAMLQPYKSVIAV